MADLNYIDRDMEVKIVGQDSTGLRVNYVTADANGNLSVKEYSNGPVSPGTAAPSSLLIGGQFNTALPTLTNTQQSAIQLDSSGRLIIRPLTSADVVSAVQSGAWTTGRTWTLSSGTDSVSATQGTSPWVSNVTQFGSSSVVTGTGASGAGIPRVTVSNDSNILVTQSTSPWVTKDQSDGPVTPGAVASFSQLIGGQFNTSFPTLTNTQQTAIQLDSSGRLIISPTTTLTVGVADKTTFTYGTTTELVIGGVFQDTSPTLTAGQSGAIRLNQNRAQHVTLRDPTTDVGVTTASNGNAGNQLLQIQAPDTTTATTALGALNATVSVAMAGLASCGFQLNAGTLIGTLVPECSLDGGTTWVTCSFYDSTNSTVSTSLVFGSSNTLKVLSILPIAGSGNVRVRVSLYTSGTANSLMRASMVIAAAGALTAAAFGTVTNSYVALTASTATQILAANGNRKYAYVSNNSGNTVAIQFGSSTGLTSTAKGLVIPSGNFYELKGDNLYTGIIYAYTTSGSVTLAVTEGTP